MRVFAPVSGFSFREKLPTATVRQPDGKPCTSDPRVFCFIDGASEFIFIILLDGPLFFTIGSRLGWLARRHPNIALLFFLPSRRLLTRLMSTIPTRIFLCDSCFHSLVVFREVPVDAQETPCCVCHFTSFHFSLDSRLLGGLQIPTQKHGVKIATSL